jgi:hypothetical protein
MCTLTLDHQTCVPQVQCVSNVYTTCLSHIQTDSCLSVSHIQMGVSHIQTDSYMCLTYKQVCRSVTFTPNGSLLLSGWDDGASCKLFVCLFAIACLFIRRFVSEKCLPPLLHEMMPILIFHALHFTARYIKSTSLRDTSLLIALHPR